MLRCQKKNFVDQSHKIQIQYIKIFDSSLWKEGDLGVWLFLWTIRVYQTNCIQPLGSLKPQWLVGGGIKKKSIHWHHKQSCQCHLSMFPSADISVCRCCGCWQALSELHQHNHRSAFLLSMTKRHQEPSKQTKYWSNLDIMEEHCTTLTRRLPNLLSTHRWDRRYTANTLG